MISVQRDGWAGFYVYDLSANLIGAVVWNDPKNLTYFNGNLQWSGYLSSNDDGGFNWFTIRGDWIGYAVANGASGYNLFNRNGQWLAFMS